METRKEKKERYGGESHRGRLVDKKQRSRVETRARERGRRDKAEKK